MDDKRGIVKRGYGSCARDYAASRDQFQNERFLEDLSGRLANGARVLDLGCGSGKPVDAFLLKRGFDVTGIHVSEEQIRLAREALPNGTFIQGDMGDVALPSGTFDAIVSFYAIFHIPREEHAGLLRKAWTLLRPGGYLLVTMGSGEWEGTEEDFHGTKMFWSHYGRERNLQLIREAGFTVLSEEIDTSGGEEHLVVLAQKAMQETPYPDVNALLGSLLAELQRILQDKLVGLYLYGSLTSGDFDSQSSDIDLLAVISAALSEAEFEDLLAMHRDLVRDNRDWEDRVEVAYVPAKALRTFRSARIPMVVVSPGEPFHTRGDEALKDWLQNWYLVREGGVTLFGPSPKEIIPPITQEEFVRAVRNYAMELTQDVRHTRSPKSQAYVVLTLCRSLHVLRRGTHVSKKEGALWAQKEFPEWSNLIQGALAWREERKGPATSDSEMTRFVAFVREQLLG